MDKNLNLVGKKFGSWEVISLLKEKTHSELTWECKCECGKIRKVRSSYLIKGRSKSCGCKRQNHKTHGMTASRIYRIWSNMHSRCNNPKVKSYSDYGAKGIKVCEEWSIFENFFNDMSDGYSDNLTIERIDNSKGYCKENCKWITREFQAFNRTNSVIIEYNGDRYCLAELAKKINVPYNRMYQQIFKLKWDIEKVINQVIKEV